MNKAVVFNQYSATSCIIAAILLAKEGGEAVQFNRVRTGFEEYVWVDVVPTKETMRMLGEVQHNFLGKGASVIELSDDDVFVLNSSLEYIIKYFETSSITLSETERSILWKIAIGTDQLEKGKHNIDIEEIAVVFTNHQAALFSLYSGEMFNLIPGNQMEYFGAIKYLKGKINSNRMTTRLEVKGKIMEVVTLNIEDRLFPWAERLLKFSFNYGILYEVSGKEIIIHTWNTQKSIVDVLVKQVENTMLTRASIRYCGMS